MDAVSHTKARYYCMFCRLLFNTRILGNASFQSHSFILSFQASSLSLPSSVCKYYSRTFVSALRLNMLIFLIMQVRRNSLFVEFRDFFFYLRHRHKPCALRLLLWSPCAEYKDPHHLWRGESVWASQRLPQTPFSPTSTPSGGTLYVLKDRVQHGSTPTPPPSVNEKQVFQSNMPVMCSEGVIESCFWEQQVRRWYCESQNGDISQGLCHGCVMKKTHFIIKAHRFWMHVIDYRKYNSTFNPLNVHHVSHLFILKHVIT